MADTKKKTGGLAGVVAGQTAVCTVGKEGKGLNYRGYSIFDLAEHATFEEVAYLLLYGELPKQKELTSFKQRLKAARELPVAVRTTLGRPRYIECSPPAPLTLSGRPVSGAQVDVVLGLEEALEPGAGVRAHVDCAVDDLVR